MPTLNEFSGVRMATLVLRKAERRYERLRKAVLRPDAGASIT